MKTREEIRHLLAELRGKDGAHREHARKTLVQMGPLATAPLMELLSDPDKHLRWEACKALGAIKDPRAAAPLANALRDENMEVQWLSAEALIALGPDALIPLLQTLETHFNSLFVRQGAYHVLRAFDYMLNEKTLALFNALRSQDPVITVAWAAHKALESLRTPLTQQPGAHHIVARRSDVVQ